MKTITEFFGTKLTGINQKCAELATAGKTPEEIAQAIGEEQKIEGDKLKLLMNAASAVKGREKSLKRVLVMTFDEKEKVPSGAQKLEEHYYVVEFFAPPPGERPAGREERGRGDRKRGDKRRGGRDEKKGRRGERGGERGERIAAPAAEGGERPARPPRKEGAPRGEKRPPRSPTPRSPMSAQATTGDRPPKKKREYAPIPMPVAGQTKVEFTDKGARIYYDPALPAAAPAPAASESAPTPAPEAPTQSV